MNEKELVAKSVHIITEYYKNNLEPFLTTIDDDFLWIGPYHGQWLETKEVINEIWKNESHNLNFIMRNVNAHTVASNNFFCEVILTFYVDILYPDETVLTREQRMQFTWAKKSVINDEGKKEKQWKFVMIHISNALEYDPRDKIYPNHLPETNKQNIREVPYNKIGNRVAIKRIDKQIVYILEDLIVWAKSDRYHTIIHTTDGEIHAIGSVAKLSKKYPDLFFRPHASYLINPKYAEEITRFQLTLQDGTIIPIPEKKYTTVKKALTEIIRNNKK